MVNETADRSPVSYSTYQPARLSCAVRGCRSSSRAVVVLADKKVFVTSMTGGLRAAGTVEGYEQSRSACHSHAASMAADRRHIVLDMVGRTALSARLVARHGTKRPPPRALVQFRSRSSRHDDGGCRGRGNIAFDGGERHLANDTQLRLSALFVTAMMSLYGGSREIFRPSLKQRESGVQVIPSMEPVLAPTVSLARRCAIS